MSVAERLEALATCLCGEVKSGGAPDVCFCGVLPGAEVALDYQGDCSDVCGMAWVRLVTTYPATVIGQANEQPGNCASQTGFDVELGVVRCIDVLDAQGNPPSPAELLTSTRLQMADRDAIVRAILCCYTTKDFLLGAYTPYGPEGGMVGGVMLVSLVD